MGERMLASLSQDWYLIGLRIERNVAKPVTFCSATFVSSFYCVPSPRGA